MSVPLESYRIFQAVAFERSVSRAAERLHVTQSAVSQSIRRLEEELDAALFIRHARGVTLTDAGRVLLERIGEPLDSILGAERYFARLRGLETGALRIGASDTLCRAVLLAPLKTFHAKHPSVSIQVTNRTSGETLELLRRGQVELGFVTLSPQDGDLSEFTQYELMELHDCFVCGEGYASRFTEPVPLSALTAVPVIMLERLSAGRRYLDRVLLRHGVELIPEFELGSMDLLVEFARANLGVAAVTLEFLPPESGDLHLVRLTEDIPPRRLCMLYRRSAALPLAVKAFIELLRPPQPRAPA